MVPRYKLILLGVPAAFTLGMLGLTTARLYIFGGVPTGTAAEYWNRVCGLQPHAESEFADPGGVYPIYRNRAFYFAQHHHGQNLYGVPLDVLDADIAALKQRLSDPSVQPISAAAAQDCQERLAQLATPPGHEDVAALAAELTATTSELREYQLEGFQAWVDGQERGWIAVPVEAVVLIGWLLFTAWPWLLAQPPMRHAAHYGAAPTLLFLPYFLGYAPLLFSSGSSGGHLYPLYALLWSLPMQVIPCSALDAWLLSALPRPLVAISALPGPPAALGIYGCVGPTATLIFGGALSAPFLLVAALRRRRRSAEAP